MPVRFDLISLFTVTGMQAWIQARSGSAAAQGHPPLWGIHQPKYFLFICVIVLY